ncbi:MAG TPA: ribosome maturation factor RimP [Sphingomonadales bacterium]|nr:ribosome maturation factor RimP [Sphingomonadales bacterium]
MKQAIEERLERLLAPAVEALGFDLVRVKLSGGRRPTLQVMAEKPDRTMGVEDCAYLSRELSAVLDAEDVIPGGYVLEVSSPGIDRPLTRLKDFAAFAGFEAKVETRLPRGGQRRFRGKLKGVAGGNIRLETENGIESFAVNDVEKAKLVLTDDLIRASLRGGKA